MKDPFAEVQKPKEAKRASNKAKQVKKVIAPDVKAARKRLEEVLAKGNLEDAILHISDVLDLVPDDAELLIQRGRVTSIWGTILTR